MSSTQFNPNSIQIIHEHACNVVSKKRNNLRIIEETTSGFTKGKIICETTLQTSDVKNQNNRIYPKAICEAIVQSLSPKAKSRALLQELDHPMDPNMSPQDKMQRAGTVKLQEVCSLIRDIKYTGNNITGIIETLKTDKGKDLEALIRESVDIGFSLRMFGKVKPYSKDPSILEVTGPMKIITYDVVHNPSHANAKILSILTEGKEIGFFNNAGDLLTENSISERFIEDIGFFNSHLLIENVDPIVQQLEVQEIELKNYILEDINRILNKVPLAQFRNLYN